MIFFVAGLFLPHMGIEEVTAKSNWGKWTSIDCTFETIHNQNSTKIKSTYHSTINSDISYYVNKQKIIKNDILINISSTDIAPIWSVGDKYQIKVNPKKTTDFMTRGDFGDGRTDFIIVIGLLYIVAPMLIGYKIKKQV